MSYKIQDIEGIGPTFGEKLAAASINTTDDLLKHCCDKQGRSTMAASTGISESMILKWTNHADMMRISGVGPEFAELLEASGVDTVKELRHRNADNLAVKMAEVNETKKLTRAVPVASIITKWVEQAKTIDPTITH